MKEEWKKLLTFGGTWMGEILTKFGENRQHLPLTRHGREEKLVQMDGSGWGRREGVVYTGQLSAGQKFEPAQTVDG